jgi:citrate lyase beta subunit
MAMPWWPSIDLGSTVTPGKKSPSLLKTEADIAFRHGLVVKTVVHPDRGFFHAFR